MFSAKFIIASLDSNSDSARIINNANCGIVVDPENEEKMILMMKKVADLDKDILITKGQNGFNYAMKNFFKAINLKKIVELLLLQNEIQICKKN